MTRLLLGLIKLSGKNRLFLLPSFMGKMIPNGPQSELIQYTDKQHHHTICWKRLVFNRRWTKNYITIILLQVTVYTLHIQYIIPRLGSKLTYFAYILCRQRPLRTYSVNCQSTLERSYFLRFAKENVGKERKDSL